MLKVDDKGESVVRGYRLKAEAKDNLAALAKAHDTSEANIINAMLIQFGDKFMPKEKK